MTDIEELVRRMRGLAEYVDDCDAAADALEAQAKRIEYLKKQLRLTDIDWCIGEARIAELEAALSDAADMLDNSYADIGRREYQVSARAARAALNGEKT